MRHPQPERTKPRSAKNTRAAIRYLLTALMAMVAMSACDDDGGGVDPPPPPVSDPTFYGPVPYLSPDDVPDGFYASGGAQALENFEDGNLDFGITATAGVVEGPGDNTDSVDSDDGAVDDCGSTRSWRLFANADVTFTFPSPVTAAGLAWTDGSHVEVWFEAFGPEMESLGTIGPFQLGDGACCAACGDTGEDRFFGVTDPAGIKAIRIWHVALSGTGDMEVDHVQMGEH